jgi:CRISPR-associated protein Cas2
MGSETQGNSAARITTGKITPASGKIYVLAVYDITANRNRYRIVKLLKSYGFRVQKSVFEAETTRTRLSDLLSRLPRYVDPRTDSMRFYVLTSGTEVYKCGVKDELTQIPDGSPVFV